MIKFSLVLTSALVPEVIVKRESQRECFHVHTIRVSLDVISISYLYCHSIETEERWSGSLELDTAIHASTSGVAKLLTLQLWLSISNNTIIWTS